MKERFLSLTKMCIRDSVKTAELDRILLQGLTARQPGLAIEHDGVSTDGSTVLFGYFCDLPRIARDVYKRQGINSTLWMLLTNRPIWLLTVLSPSTNPLSKNCLQPRGERTRYKCQKIKKAVFPKLWRPAPPQRIPCLLYTSYQIHTKKFGIAIRISRIRKPIFHVRTDTEKSRS